MLGLGLSFYLRRGTLHRESQTCCAEQLAQGAGAERLRGATVQEYLGHTLCAGPRKFYVWQTCAEQAACAEHKCTETPQQQLARSTSSRSLQKSHNRKRQITFAEKLRRETNNLRTASCSATAQSLAKLHLQRAKSADSLAHYVEHFHVYWALVFIAVKK